MRKVISGRIAFSNGDGSSTTEAYCYPFPAGNTQVQISYALSGVTVVSGDTILATVQFINSGGGLVLKFGPTSATLFNIPASAVPDRTTCNQFILVVSKKPATGATRVVATEEFRICPSCP